MKKILLFSFFMIACLNGFSTTLAPKAMKNMTSKESPEASLKLGEKGYFYFWATWCSICETTLTKNAKADARHGGLPIFAIATETNEEKVMNFIEKRELKLPIYFDKDRQWQKELKIFSVPTVVLVERVQSGFQVISSSTEFKN